MTLKILCCSARKITGHIMRVDGGKGITSRGQSDWYGWPHMNRRFEQEASKSYVNYRMNHQEIPNLRPGASEEQIEDYISKVQTSKWAIKSDEAH